MKKLTSKLRLESLEDRSVPALFTFTLPTDLNIITASQFDSNGTNSASADAVAIGPVGSIVNATANAGVTENGSFASSSSSSYFGGSSGSATVSGSAIGEFTNITSSTSVTIDANGNSHSSGFVSAFASSGGTSSSSSQTPISFTKVSSLSDADIQAMTVRITTPLSVRLSRFSFGKR